MLQRDILYKSATQRQLNSSNDAGYIKKTPARLQEFIYKKMYKSV